MTQNEEKDLKNAKEFLNKFEKKEFALSRFHRKLLETALKEYPTWLEEKVIVKFTEIRERT